MTAAIRSTPSTTRTRAGKVCATLAVLLPVVTRVLAKVPFAEMRSVSAVMGGLLVPLTYWILRELDVSVLASFTAAVMLCFDNALVTQSRFILLDAQLLLPIMFATLSWLKFSKYQLHEYALDRTRY